MELRIAIGSDKGRRRKRNEDRVLACGPGSGSHSSESWHLLAVADGMGGAPGGAIASETAIEKLRSRFPPDTEPENWLQQSFIGANDSVLQRGQADARYRGLGTTLVAALVAGHDLWIANVGDSRAYLWRRGALTQLTNDHSLVAQQVAAGQLSEREARVSPRRNVITKSIGGRASVRVDISHVGRLQPNDTLLLCSDGLHTMLASEQISDVLAVCAPESAVGKLITLANESGGLDNIAVVVAQVADPLHNGD